MLLWFVACISSMIVGFCACCAFMFVAMMYWFSYFVACGFCYLYLGSWCLHLDCQWFVTCLFDDVG